MIQTVVWKYGVWLVLCVAFIVRLALALGVQHVISQKPGRLCLIEGDAEGYWKLAGQLAAGDKYSLYDPPRRVMRMPGFPLLLALPRMVFGDSLLAARLLLAIVGTLGCALTYWLGRELSGHTTGLIAASYTALSPAMALFSVLLLSEVAFATAMMASLVAAAKLVHISTSRAGEKQSYGLLVMALVTGALIGLATYMRPTWLLVGPGLASLIVLFDRRPVQTRWAVASCIMIGLAASLAPWTIRNANITGHFVPTTLWVGPSLYDGLNPAAKGDSNMDFFEEDQLLKRMSEYEMDHEYRRRAWAFAAENPSRAAWLALVKQTRYWSPIPNAVEFSGFWYQIGGWCTFLPLILLGIVGAWYSRKDIWLLILTVAPIFYFAAIHLLFVGSLRYRLPAEYPLSVLSAIGLCHLLQSKNRRTDFSVEPSPQ